MRLNKYLAVLGLVLVTIRAFVATSKIGIFPKWNSFGVIIPQQIPRGMERQ
jgi:hypothetical protein